MVQGITPRKFFVFSFTIYSIIVFVKGCDVNGAIISCANLSPKLTAIPAGPWNSDVVEIDFSGNNITEVEAGLFSTTTYTKLVAVNLSKLVPVARKDPMKIHS